MPGSRITRLAASVDRHRFVILALLSALYFYSVAIRAAAKPFWHDEIYTILLTGLPSLGTMWSAMRDGVDLAPPLNAVLTRGVRALTGVDPIGFRLVPIISFWLMMLLIFALVRRRADALTALTAAIFPFFTAAYRYAYEARSYALMMALFALALFAWSEAAAGRRRRLNLTMLAVALAAGLWNHYYAVLSYLPVAAGEAIRIVRTRRVDTGVLAALAVSVAASLPVVTLVSAASQQSSFFWSPASGDQFVGVYSFLLEPLLYPQSLLAAGLIAGIAVSGYALRSRHPAPGTRTLPAHELAAFVTAAMIPLAGVSIGLLVTGVFVPRYALPGAVGLSVAVPLGIWYLSARARAAELVLPCMFLVSLTELLLPVVPPPHPVEPRRALLASLRSPGPTAVTGALTFLQLWYYAPPQLKPRLIYLADSDAARRYTNSDTLDLGLLALARWTPVTARPFDAFIAGNHDFRVYAFGSGWLMDELRARGVRLDELAVDASATLYRVNAEF